MKIYYDAKDEQIKDKNGVCRYDQSAILELIGGADERINAHFKLCEEREANLKAQLQCGAKGHGKWEFVKKDTATGVLTIGCGEAQFLFFFKCKSCGLEITKRKKELTAKEKEGLAKLGLLQEIEMQIYRMVPTQEQEEKLNKEYKKLLQTKTVKRWGKEK